jgi:hypothetical protein
MSKADRTDSKSGSTGVSNDIPDPRFLYITSDTIPPGESKPIPILLTLTRSGRIDLRGFVIAAAETSADDVAASTFACTVDCQSLLSVNTATQYSRRRLGDHLIDVEISNTADVTVELDTMAFISPFWNATLPEM